MLRLRFCSFGATKYDPNLSAKIVNLFQNEALRTVSFGFERLGFPVTFCRGGTLLRLCERGWHFALLVREGMALCFACARGGWYFVCVGERGWHFASLVREGDGTLFVWVRGRGTLFVWVRG